MSTPEQEASAQRLLEILQRQAEEEEKSAERRVARLTSLEDEIKKQSDQIDSRGNIIPMRTVIQHKFGVDFDPPSTANEEGFVDLSELTEDDLTNWILRKWNHKRIQEMDMFKAAVNALKSREGKSRRDFKPKQGYINA